MRIHRGNNQVNLQHRRATITFANNSGTVTVFTLTGRVMVLAVAAFVTVDVVETGAVTGLEFGVTADPNLFILSANPSDLDANEWWTDASPQAGGVAMDDLQKDKLIAQDPILTITGGTDLASGTIVFDIWYLPITDDGALAA